MQVIKRENYKAILPSLKLNIPIGPTHLHQGLYGKLTFGTIDELIGKMEAEDAKICEHLKRKPYYIQEDVVKKCLAEKLMEVVSLKNVVFYRQSDKDMFAIYTSSVDEEMIVGEMSEIIKLDYLING